MNYIFFGTPDFAAIILKKLIDAGYPPKAVVCNPDRPAGRRKVLTAPAVKLKTEDLKLKTTILQPEILDAAFITQLKSFNADFAVLAAYGKILPKEIITLFPKGIVGVHPSLLPKYRGATPIQSVFLNGEKETGTSLFILDAKVDHGLILAQEKLAINELDTRITLEKKLALLSADLLIKTLLDWVEGKIKPKTQIESEATYTKKIATEDGFVDLEKDDPLLIYRKIKALNPEPGVYAFITKGDKKIRLKILEAELRDGKLILTKVQEEGKRPRSFGL